MSVTGYLALYTTLLGWQQYQNLWTILVETGLIYLPFIGIVLTCCVGPFTSMDAKEAAQIALRRMSVQIITGLFVIAFAGVPAVHLNPSILHYTPICQPDHHTATPGHTGTTYDQAFAVPTNVKVPVFWYLVMAIANGVTHAANKGLSCAPIPYRDLHDQLNVTQIHDPKLKQQVIQFYNACYVPAYSDYMRGHYSTTQQNLINRYLEKYGHQDTQWLGSQMLLHVPGFYDAYHAPHPVTGFAFNPSRDMIDGQLKQHPQWGKPSCVNWWLNSQYGLRTQLIHALPHTLLQRLLPFGHWVPGLENAAIKTLIVHNFREAFQQSGRGYASLEDSMSGDFITRFVSMPLGISLESLTFYPKLHLLINSLPIIQGALLFAVYVFLALALPLARFQIGFCVMAAMVVFSLVFCSFIWHLVAWFDQHLIKALYPSLFSIPAMGGLLSANNNLNERFVTMVIATLYVVLPLLWMTILSWTGIQVGGFLSGMIGGMSAPSRSAGQAPGQFAKSAIMGSAMRVVNRGPKS